MRWAVERDAQLPAAPLFCCSFTRGFFPATCDSPLTVIVQAATYASITRANLYHASARLYLLLGQGTRDSAREARPVPRDQSPVRSFQSSVADCNGL